MASNNNSKEEEKTAQQIVQDDDDDDDDSEEEEGKQAAAGDDDDAAGGGDRTTTAPRVVELPVDWTKLGTEPNETPPIRYPSDVTDIDPNELELILVGTAGKKITHMGPDFYKQLNPQLTQLVFRSHLIRTMEGLQGLQCLDLLELYDNQVDGLQCLNQGENGAPGQTLRVLDMSYNVIRDMQPVEFCPNLQELYLANNKIKTMAGLKGLKLLKKIDLGANRIRVMDVDELSGLVNLQELWLGKNKIEQIQGLEPLKKLKRLDIQSNRLTVVENLTSQTETLEELYLAHNGIDDEGASHATGLAQAFPQLSILDLSRNKLQTTNAFGHLTSLDELWLSGNNIATFADVQSLASLGEHLETVYLEYNAVQKEDPLYRKKLAELVPSLKQIDADLIGGLSTAMRHGHVVGASSGASGSGGVVVAETEEQRMRRLQNMAIERAKVETTKSKATSSATNK